MHNAIALSQLRSFGLIVGGIFTILGILPAIVRGGSFRWWSVVVGGCLVLPAAVFPQSLYWPYRGWTAVGNALGWVNSRIILGVVFYVVVTPIGLVRRWLGRDPMGRRLRPDLKTYRVPRKSRPAGHLKNQF